MNTSEQTIEDIEEEFEVHRENAGELDQFYTNPKVAKAFVDEIDRVYGFDNFDHIIEPSMGEGFIYQYLPPEKRIGLDIEKNHPDCIEGDFLKWLPAKAGIESNPLLLQNPRIMFVGNPPFGRNSSLATDFFNHAAKFSDVICFIIPRTWMKWSVHRQLHPEFGLYYNAILPDDSFIYQGNPYTVKCVAQCWSKFDPNPESDIEENHDWRETLDLSID